MTLKKVVVLAGLLFLIPLIVHAEDAPHEGDSTKKATRPSSEKKTPSTLAEKVSACLAERPGSEKKAEEKPAAPSEKPTPTWGGANSSQVKTNGPAVFSQFCKKCHDESLDGAKAINKLGAGQMPPAGEPQPSTTEKQALIEYFSGQK